jgi:hypothetical protein
MDPPLVSLLSHTRKGVRRQGLNHQAVAGEFSRHFFFLLAKTYSTLARVLQSGSRYPEAGVAYLAGHREDILELSSSGHVQGKVSIADEYALYFNRPLAYDIYYYGIYFYDTVYTSTVLYFYEENIHKPLRNPFKITLSKKICK